VKVFLMYGLSEAFRSSYLPPDQIDARRGSMGKAIPETDLFVVRDDNTRAEPGEVGQLVHAGPTVALGYFGDPERTAAVFKPHPFSPSPDERVVYSGDLVKADAEGFLYFVGRRDLQMKSHGLRFSPEEVEEIVQRAELVAEVVARGEPDDVAGQAVVLHVVAKHADTFTTDALLAFCRREMPRYMVPARIYVHADLPRTSSGKVDRKQVGV
jgi:acyl-CoA synthetase (AMP-forming)/AMP-acid ligase II